MKKTKNKVGDAVMPKLRPNNTINNKNTKHSINNNSRLGETTKKQDANSEALKTVGNALGRGCL